MHPFFPGFHARSRVFSRFSCQPNMIWCDRSCRLPRWSCTLTHMKLSSHIQAPCLAYKYTRCFELEHDAHEHDRWRWLTWSIELILANMKMIEDEDNVGMPHVCIVRSSSYLARLPCPSPRILCPPCELMGTACEMMKMMLTQHDWYDRSSWFSRRWLIWSIELILANMKILLRCSKFVALPNFLNFHNGWLTCEASLRLAFALDDDDKQQAKRPQGY